MSPSSLAKRLVIILLLTIVTIFLSLPPHRVLAQQPAPFLVTPYYGTKGINAYFDHKYPTYNVPPNTTYANVVIFNGGDLPSCNFIGQPGTYCYNGHDGIDFQMSYERVIAAADGDVIQAGWENTSCRSCGFGLRIEIRHTNNNNYVTRYAHLSSTTVLPGQTVRAGQVIGMSGNTGSSTGAHLHFGVLNQNNLRVDPFGWTGGYTDPWQQNSGAVSSCLWKDGEWANYCGGVSRPIPSLRTSGEIIIDDTTNNSGGFSKGTGSQVFLNPCTGLCSDWGESGTGGYNGHRYWNPVTNTSTAANWAAWAPTIGSNNQGWYDVEAYIPASNATTWQATYQVRHNSGQTPVTVDQAGLNNTWVSLGVYQLTFGNAYISVTDATGNEGSPNNHCGVGSTCQVGVDAVRFRKIATYLPDIRSANSEGWDSAFYIRNDGAGPTDIHINVLNQSGASVETSTYINLAVQGQLYYNPVLSGLDGAVVVTSRQPISVVATQQDLSPFRAAAYTGVSQPATEAHIPLLHKNNGAWTSDLFIQNTGNSSANVTVAFKAWTGSSCPASYSIPAYGLQIINLANVSCVGSPFVGAAQITSTNQPVAVGTTERTTLYVMETSIAVGAAANKGYLPLIQNEGGTGWTSGLSLQNVSNNTQTLSADYYIRSGAGCGSASYAGIGPYFPKIVNPFPPACPDIVEAASLSGPDRVTGMLNQIRSSNSYASTYMAIPSPSKTIYLPFWLKSSSWAPGLAVYNPNTSAVNVIVRYYNADGSLRDAPPGQSLAAHGVAIFYNTPAAPSFSGSAIVFADQPVTAVLNHSGTSGGDSLMTYEGMHY